MEHVKSYKNVSKGAGYIGGVSQIHERHSLLKILGPVQNVPPPLKMRRNSYSENVPEYIWVCVGVMTVRCATAR